MFCRCVVCPSSIYGFCLPLVVSSNSSYFGLAVQVLHICSSCLLYHFPIVLTTGVKPHLLFLLANTIFLEYAGATYLHKMSEVYRYERHNNQLLHSRSDPVEFKLLINMITSRWQSGKKTHELCIDVQYLNTHVPRVQQELLTLPRYSHSLLDWVAQILN